MLKIFCNSLKPIFDTILIKFCHSRTIISFNLFKLLRRYCDNFCFIIAQSVSIGVKSRDCAGKERSLNCFDLNTALQYAWDHCLVEKCNLADPLI